MPSASQPVGRYFGYSIGMLSHLGVEDLVKILAWFILFECLSAMAVVRKCCLWWRGHPGVDPSPALYRVQQLRSSCLSTQDGWPDC